MSFLLTFQSPVYGNSHESVQSRRVVISHNMDKALKEGKDLMRVHNYHREQFIMFILKGK